MRSCLQGTVWESKVLEADLRWNDGGNGRCLTWTGEAQACTEHQGTLCGQEEYYFLTRGKNSENWRKGGFLYGGMEFAVFAILAPKRGEF